jgi:hypothetical protein
MRWAGHVARIGANRNAYRASVFGITKNNLGVGGRIALRWILEKKDGIGWIRLAQDRDQWCVLIEPSSSGTNCLQML